MKLDQAYIQQGIIELTLLSIMQHAPNDMYNTIMVVYQLISLVLFLQQDRDISRHPHNKDIAKQTIPLSRSIVLLTAIIWYFQRSTMKFEVLQFFVKLQLAHILMVHYKHKFTICESYLIANLSVQHVSWLKEQLTYTTVDVLTHCSKVLLGLSVLTYASIILIGKIEPVRKETKYCVTLFLIFKVHVIILVYSLSQQNLQLRHIFDMIVNQEFFRFAGVLLLLTVAPLIVIQILKSKRLVRNIIIRKLFHLQISMIILAGLSMNRNLTVFSLAAMIWIFLVVEAFRQVNYDEISYFNSITNYMVKYIDKRDDNTLIMTHIYLIQGVSSGLFYMTFTGNQCRFYTSMIGMVVLGIGDSFAAIIGSIHGSRKLMNSSKTLEGLAAFIASSLIFLFHLYLITSALSWPICDQISITSNSISIDYQLIAIIVGMGFVEVSTQQVDNLLLPLMATEATLLIM